MENDGKTNERLDPAILKVAFILLVGALAPLFDTTIMNVALNTLGRDLHASISTVQWVMTGFLLALGMVIPVTGWAIERFGGKQMWLLALVVFLCGSILAGLSWNIGSLIAFRILQGIGGGMMMPIMQIIIVQAAGGRKLGKIMSVVSMPALLGPILGPVIGGLILNHLNWHWLFYVNVPVCVAALILAWFGLPSTDSIGGKKHLDVIGLALLSPALVALLDGLGQVGARGGFDNLSVGIPMAVGTLLLTTFIIYALRTNSKPLINLRLFQIHSFTSSGILLFLSGLTTYGAMLLLPLYYQQVREDTIVATGFSLIPQGIGALLTRGWIGKLTDRVGARWVVVVSNVVVTVGTLPFALAGPHTNSVLLDIALAIRGAGLGGVTIPVMATAFQGVRKEQVPDASTASRIMQQVGGAFGAAVFAVILDKHLSGHVLGISKLASAFESTFWWAFGFALLTFIPAFFLPGRTRETAN